MKVMVGLVDTHLTTEPGGTKSSPETPGCYFHEGFRGGHAYVRGFQRPLEWLKRSSNSFPRPRYHPCIFILAWVRVILSNYAVISIVSASPLGMISVLAAEISRGCWPGRETMTFSGSVLDILMYRSI